MDDRTKQLEIENERLRNENLILQDEMTKFFGQITDEERRELIRYRISYRSLGHAYEQACHRIEELTGRDPRLPIRSGDQLQGRR